MARGLVSYARRRDLLHVSQLDAFAAWVQGQGYVRHPSSPKATYEVLRIERYDPCGSNEHLVFYRRLAPAGHITVPAGGVPLVKAFIRDRARAR